MNAITLDLLLLIPAIPSLVVYLIFQGIIFPGMDNRIVVLMIWQPITMLARIAPLIVESSTDNDDGYQDK